jgi:hypothetical protein
MPTLSHSNGDGQRLDVDVLAALVATLTDGKERKTA